VKTENELQVNLQLAENVCKGMDGKLTPKRRQVLTILLQAEKAISAYELMELYEVQFKKKLMPMTTYRTLEFLESVHLAHRLNTANKYVACAHIGHEHSHDLPQFLICQKCLCVDELSVQVTNNLSNIAKKVEQTGYQLLAPQIELNCICNACCAAEQNN